MVLIFVGACAGPVAAPDAPIAPVACEPGFFAAGSPPVCVAIRACVAGTQQVAPATATSDRVCEACAPWESCPGDPLLAETCAWPSPGHRATEDCATPVALAVGAYGACALDDAGAVLCWGVHGQAAVIENLGAVVAVAAAIVVRIERSELGRDKRSGRYVRLEHEDGALTSYMHLDEIADGLEVGDRVIGGQQIGLLGATAVYKAAPHLHFDLALPNTPGRHGDSTDVHYVDPMPFLARATILAAPDRRRPQKANW